MRAVLWKALTASPTATKVETPASEPDIAKAREYLEALSPDETEFTFQTFDDKKLSRRLARVLNGRRDAHFERLCALSRQGAGACVTINRTDLKGRKTENVVETRAAFVDLDGAPIDNWKRLSLRPHMGVRSSPGRAHLYYRVKGIGLDEWPEIQDRLRVLMEGDDAVCDLPRVMRLPGFPHQKYDPFMVEGAYTPNLPNAYTRDGFLKALDEAEEKRAADGARQSDSPSTKAPKPKSLADLCAFRRPSSRLSTAPARSRRGRRPASSAFGASALHAGMGRIHTRRPRRDPR